MSNPFNLSAAEMIDVALKTFEKGQYNAAQLIIEQAIILDNTNIDAKLCYFKILVATGGNRSIYDYKSNKAKAVNLHRELKKAIDNKEIEFNEFQQQQYREAIINYVQFIEFIDNAENQFYNPF